MDGMPPEPPTFLGFEKEKKKKKIKLDPSKLKLAPYLCFGPTHEKSPPKK